MRGPHDRALMPWFKLSRLLSRHKPDLLSDLFTMLDDLRFQFWGLGWWTVIRDYETDELKRQAFTLNNLSNTSNGNDDCNEVANQFSDNNLVWQPPILGVGLMNCYTRLMSSKSKLLHWTHDRVEFLKTCSVEVCISEKLFDSSSPFHISFYTEQLVKKHQMAMMRNVHDEILSWWQR